MKKKAIVLATCGVLVSGMVGAQFYADHRLKAYYSMQEINKDKRIQKQAMNIDMGMWSGHANWSYKILIDPCQPNKFVVIKGVDKIQRSWNGFNIHSDINLELQGESAKQYQELLKGKALFTTDSKLNWLGNLNVKLTSPSLEYRDSDSHVVWSGMDGTLAFKQDQGEFDLTQMNVNMPGLTGSSGGNYLSLQSMVLKGKGGLLGQTLRSGDNEFTMNKMLIVSQKSKQPMNIELQKLKFSSDVDVDSKETSLKNTWSIEQVKSNNQQFKNIKINFNIAGLDSNALQQFIRISNKGVSECSAEAQTAQQQQLNQQLVNLMAHGLSFESKDNQIEVGTSKLSATATGKVPAHAYTNIQDISRQIGKLVEINANAEMDKSFIREVMKASGQASMNMSEQDYEMMLQQMVKNAHAQLQDNKVKFAMSYKNGNVSYP
ncbi:DUF945 family protein [Acinetobacter sp. MD2]|uniref:DUF945 family protein n=1 Tax=Acinetobacter sp. MD2 TaxID=2600066 RepID=UPI002D1E6B22|nr:DUF945 family protein [Acinetobacter sp. MD2]MEB3766157.1 DUF945 family protein [Acinetobacter sp. MD2]